MGAGTYFSKVLLRLWDGMPLLYSMQNNWFGKDIYRRLIYSKFCAPWMLWILTDLHRNVRSVIVTNFFTDAMQEVMSNIEDCHTGWNICPNFWILFQEAICGITPHDVPKDKESKGRHQQEKSWLQSLGLRRMSLL